MPDYGEYYEEMQGECPDEKYIQPEVTWKNTCHQNMNRSRCGCCRNRIDYASALDYDYREYRKNCYANIFKEADCKK